MSVQSLTDSATGFAAAQRNLATANIAGLTSGLRSAFSSIPAVSYDKANLPDATGMRPLPLEIPTLQVRTLDLPPPLGSPPQFQDIDPIDIAGKPSNSATKQTLNLPTKPSQVRGFTGGISSIRTNFVFPEAPSELKNTFAAPSISAHAMPDAPNIEAKLSAVSFNGQKPLDNLVAPGDLEAKFATSHQSSSVATMTMINGYVDAQLTKLNPQYHAQMARIEAQLDKYLNGGTGVNSAVEDAIYSRSRSKQDAEARRVRDSAISDTAARGFTIPNGAMFSALQQARQGAADNNAVAAREIVVMQAEMEQKNLQFAVTTSTGLRTAMVNAALSYMQTLVSINGQAIDFAKTSVGFVVEIFNSGIRLFSARLDGYKAEVAVYEAQLRAVLAYLEVYKGELQAAEMEVGIDKLKVDTYRAQIESLNSLASLYRTQVEAVVSEASLEKMKIDLFGAQVNAYQAEVSAKNSEWSAFSAEVQGELAKVQLYRSEVDGFSTEMAAYKTGIDAQMSAISAAASNNEARSRLFSSEVSSFTAQVNAQSSKVQAEIESDRQVFNAFKSEIDIELARVNAEATIYKTEAQINMELAQKDFESKAKNAEIYVMTRKIPADLDIAASNIYSSLASAAMAGLNTLAAETKAE